MPTCKECKNEVDELISVKINGRRRKLCEDCIERLEEEGQIAMESEAVIRDMMEYKGTR
jgi:hypothetical protein